MMAGRMVNGAAALAEMVRAAEGADELGVHRVLPVVPELGGLLPGRGLRRGSTVAVAAGAAVLAGGGTSLLLALLAGASRSGSWCAVVGVPTLGAVAAAESGIALDRLALVPNPGPDWPTVVAALIDGVDVVVTAVPGQVSGSIASRLAARARQRGSVLVPFGQWSGADVTLQVTAGRWEGLGSGLGRLRRREVTVLARGRGAAARPKEITLWMPGLSTRPFTIPPAPATPNPTTRTHILPIPPSPEDPPADAPAPTPPAGVPAFIPPVGAPAPAPAADSPITASPPPAQVEPAVIAGTLPSPSTHDNPSAAAADVLDFLPRARPVLVSAAATLPPSRSARDDEGGSAGDGPAPRRRTGPAPVLGLLSSVEFGGEKASGGRRKRRWRGETGVG